MSHPRHSPCCSQIIIFQVGAKLVIGKKFGNFHTGSCGFSRVIKEYAIRINYISSKAKMPLTNRQTPRTNDTSFSLRGQSRVHAKQGIGSAANLYHYSCLTYTRDTIQVYRYRSDSYTSIDGKIRVSVRHTFILSTIPISYSHDRYFAELKFCIVFSAILFFPCMSDKICRSY